MSHARDVAEVMAQALADHPDQVRVIEVERGSKTVVELTVAPGDAGKMLGRQGRTIAALRTLVAATAEREGRSATLEFRDLPGRG